MWHAELIDLENNRNIKVVPEILNCDQLVKLKEYSIKHNLVLLIEPVTNED